MIYLADNFEPEGQILAAATLEVDAKPGTAVLSSLPQLVSVCIQAGIPYEEDDLNKAGEHLDQGGKVLLIATPKYTHAGSQFCGFALTTGDHDPNSATSEADCLDLQLKLLSAREVEEISEGAFDEDVLTGGGDDEEDRPTQHFILFALPRGIINARVFIIEPDETDATDETPLDAYPPSFLQPPTGKLPAPPAARHVN